MSEPPPEPHEASWQPPETGHFAELVEGILWIRLPIPGGLRHINVWLVPASRGWYLVDTGMKTPEVRAAWDELGRRLPLATGLEAIVLTHHHPDHYGMARWLSEEHGAAVVMSDRAAAAARAALAEDPPGHGLRSDGFAERLGLELDQDMQAILRGGIYRRIVSGPVATAPLEAGSRLPGSGDGWSVTLHEGHAPGHACLLHEAGRILVSGDQVLPSISSNVSLYPSNEEGDPLGDYLGSLDRLAGLHADTLVLPAHGLPFRRLHGRIEGLRREHAQRLQAIRESCRQPRSTRQVADELFRLGRLDALNRLLATTETLAHIRHLELRGQVAREGSGAHLRWRTT